MHIVTAVVAVAALVLQTVLVVTGASVLAEQEVPPLLTRLGRLVSYFTIQSNLLVAVTAVQLARDPCATALVATGAGRGARRHHRDRPGPLRPAAAPARPRGRELGGRQAAAHGRPVLAVVGWLVAGRAPRPVARRPAALVWPVAWLVWTLVVGAVSGWYPYPFLDVGAEGAGRSLSPASA